MAEFAQIAPEAHEILLKGVVIPAHPLALTAERRLDERRQRALTRYYCAAGAGGVAVGVHTTQFQIHDPSVGLLRPVLELAAETVREHEAQAGTRIVRVAGICGDTPQAVREAALAAELGYDAGLLSLSALAAASEDRLIEHAQQVAHILPLFGFYLQPAVGGRVLDVSFWRRFFEIPNVAAVKIAPFHRYRTVDVVRALAESGRIDVALYTGNDDNIVADLVTPFRIGVDGGFRTVRIVGGLLGHWAFWTRRAVELLERVHALVEQDRDVPQDLLALGVQTTEANAAVFDVDHDFAGCIPGIHEVLRRQGLLAGTWCLDPHETLSPGQQEEIDRIIRRYPFLTDEDFTREHLDQWLR